MTEIQGKEAREKAFVRAIIKRCKNDNGFAARTRRADNPATEYQSWETLASFGVDLESEYIRLPFIITAAAIAKAKAENNGQLKLGEAIAACYSDGNQSEQAKARLRRLLACESVIELAKILRPLFSLINSRVDQGLDYIDLLKQLRSFTYENQTSIVKARWAQQFYSSYVTEQDSVVTK